MEGTTEKDCSPLWNLYQQIVMDMKNSTPMWEEFISKATKLHSALKSALVAIAAFLDAFQKIADAATNARGATKEIGTALTRVCLRHRAIETRMKTFIGALMDTLVVPLSERAEEWRRGGGAAGAGAGGGALGREHARECKRARNELRRRIADAQRHHRKARRAPPDAKRRADVCMQDVQERKLQLEEMEEKAVKAALIEERSRFCHFVSLLNPVVECEVAMLAEVGHLQEGSEQLVRHTAEPRTLPAASLQVICDIKSCHSAWECPSAPHSPSGSSRLGSRKSSLTSISSLNSQCSDNQHVPSVTSSCSAPVSAASDAPVSTEQSAFRLSSVCSADSGFRSQDALQRRSLYVDNGSDNQSVSSECVTPAKSNIEDDTDDVVDERDTLGNAAAVSAAWPELKDTAQFERAASAIMAARPHALGAGGARPALGAHSFRAHAPPLPARCSSLERGADVKAGKPSSLPQHLTKELPGAVYVNMSELATLAAARAHHHEKVCSESSASESSLESSSGYGSQGAFAAEDTAHQHAIQHADVECEIVTLRRDTVSRVSEARESFSLSLGSLEAAVRELDAASEASEAPAFATVGKKPAVPKRRPLSMTAAARSASAPGKPPPPARRSSICRPHHNAQNPSMVPTDADNLPPPPAFLLQPDNETANGHPSKVSETVKQLTELRHTPASPGLVRRSVLQLQASANTNTNTQHALTTFQQSGKTLQQSKSNFPSSTSINSTGNLNPIYGQTGHRIVSYVENARKNSLNTSNSDLFRDVGAVYGSGIYSEGRGSPQEPSPHTPADNTFSSFGPRVSNGSHYGQTGFKMQQEKKYGPSNTIYAQPSQIIAGFNSMSLARHDTLSPLALRRNIAARSHSADRHHAEPGVGVGGVSPQGSPRAPRRPLATTQEHKGKGGVQAAFLDQLSAALTHRITRRAPAERAHAQAHSSLMEQIKRGATLRRNHHCDDRSAPKIR